MKMPRKVQKVIFHTGIELKSRSGQGNIVVNSMMFKDPKTDCELYEHPHGVKAIQNDGTEHVLPVGSVVKQYTLMPRDKAEKDDE